MLQIELKIQSLKDKDKPAFPELLAKKDEGKLLSAEITKVLVMEGATQKGKTGIHIAGETEDGTVIVLQTSAEILEGINAAAKGAAERFKD